MSRTFVSQGLGEGMKLGTKAGDLERQARRLERQGYRGQAGQLRGEAALLRAENRGFSSSEQNIQRMREGEEVMRYVRNEELNTLVPQGGQTTGQPTGRLGSDAGGRPTSAPTGQQSAPAPRSSNMPLMVEARNRQQELALAGNFGEAARRRAEKRANIESRKSLFQEMKASQDPASAEFRQRASALGVDDRGFEIAQQRLGRPIRPAAGETMQQPNPAPAPTPTAAPSSATGGQTISQLRADIANRRQEIAQSLSQTAETRRPVLPQLNADLDGEIMEAQPTVPRPTAADIATAQTRDAQATVPRPTAAQNAAATPIPTVGMTRAEAQQIPRDERNYQQRMTSGVVTADDMRRTASRIGQAVQTGVNTARRFQDRSNLWADTVRTRINQSLQ